MRIAISLAGVVAVMVAVWLTVETRRNRLVWDHFDVVKHGILYRSGQLNGDQLADVVQRYGIRTVINFQIPGKAVEAERALARAARGRLRQPADAGRRLRPGIAVPRGAQGCDDPERRPS